MNLIQISPNVLVNPNEICYVEQRKTKNGSSIKVGVSGKEFDLEIPLQDFYNSLGIAEQSQGGQSFAG